MDTPTGEVEGGGRRWLLRASLFVLVALALVGAGFYWMRARQFVSTDDAFIDAHVVRVAPQVAGIIGEVRVVPNQRVSEGDVLVTILPDVLQPQLEGRSASVAATEAAEGQAEAEIERARATGDAARASVKEASASLKNAQQDLDRLEKTERVDASAIVARTLDAARAAVAEAEAQVQAANSMQAAATADIALAVKAREAAAASVKAARASSDEASVRLADTTIAASLAGFIANISINRGSYVSPGLQIMALVPDDLWVTANFKETDLNKIRVGDSVEVTVDAYPGRAFPGRVESVQRAAGQQFQLLPPQNASGNFVKVVQRVPVRIVFTESLPKDLVLGPGMSVVPRVRIAR